MVVIRRALYGLLAVAAAATFATTPAAAQTLKVSVDSVARVKVIPDKYAFCNPAKEGHTKPGADVSPRVSWSRGPAGTKSYAIVAFDPDVPSIRTDMNQEGKTLSATMPRVTFFHWVLVDIPPSVRSLKAGADANGRVAHGKPQSPSTVGLRGLNGYTNAFAANEQMKGDYFGYDGPCPPWNDEIPHHYHFTVYALSASTLNLSGAFTGADAMKAMEGLVLAKGEVVGVYAQNPEVLAKLRQK
ncbi:MAG TPA: YbhB/YbcL family Raf kinase inhibitor-like protein [Alphaproteobacteria bacterium]|nr:YbhB/YbcL family Raf kinase inhibitor-like protein [Alphaproteobacteria bacterium]